MELFPSQIQNFLAERVKKAICEIKCFDLTKEAVRILHIFYLHDQKFGLEKNF